MSKVIDSKVVEMEFDNEDFERNVSTTMSTLEKLKSKLNFSEASKAFGELDNASGRVNFSGLGQAIETIQTKFSAFEVVAVGALMRIGSRAADASVELVKSLSVDQIASGWTKYADKTTSVQTIMAATADQFDDTAKQMDVVSSALGQLNWFTDETSYNFVDMTSNIGKFTSAGVGLDDAVIAMQGIAAEAAISGQNAQAASRAMYNFSQSLGVGAVKLQDWMSIENANMATKEFKETLIKTAEELGVVKEGAITFQNFRETLTNEWLTSDVLMKSLEKYGKFSMELSKVMEEVWENTDSFTTSQFVSYVEEYKNGSKVLNEWTEETGLSSERLTEILETLSSAEYDLGFRSFKAAQEAKTFAEAIDSVKDAVSTGWMNTFELIFGNYEQAKTLWTELAERLYNVFAVSGESRNAVLKEWSELPGYFEGSRDQFIKTLWELWDVIESITGTIREAFEEIFPPITWKNLYDLVLAFKDFVKSIKPTETVLENIKRTFKGLFAILDIGKQFIMALLTPIGNLLKYLGLVGENVLDTTASWGDWLVGISEFIKENKVFEEAIGRVSDLVVSAYNFVSTQIQKILNSPAIQNALDALSKLFTGAWDGISGFFDNAMNALGGFFDSAKEAVSIGDIFSALYESIKSLFSGMQPLFDDVGKAFDNVTAYIKQKIVDIITFLSGINWAGVFAGLAGAAAVGGIIYTIKSIIDIFTGLSKAAYGFGDMLGTIGDAIAERIKYGKSKLNLSIIIAFIGAIALFAGVIALMSLAGVNNAIEYAGAISILMGALSASFFIISKSDTFRKDQLQSLLVSMGIMTLIMAALGGIIMLVSLVDTSNAIVAATGIGILMLALSASLILLDKAGFKGLAPMAMVSIGFMELMLLGLVGIMALLGNIEMNGLAPSLATIENISLLILSLSGAMILLELAGLAGPAVFTGLAALTVLIGELALMIIGLGALQEQFPILKDVVDNGIDLLCKLGDGLGSFFGSIVSGFLDTASAGLVAVGNNLSAFMTAVQPFLDGMTNIDEGLVRNIDTLMNAVLKLALSDFLNAVTAFITGEQDYSAFKTRLLAFADAYKAFADAMKGVATIDQETLDGVSAIVTLYDKMPKFGGLVQMFTGEQNLDMFGGQLVRFALSYKRFAESMQGVPIIDSQTLSDMIAIADWYDKAPKFGGFVQMFTGEQDLDRFGGQIIRFALSYKRFAESMQGIDIIPSDVLENMISIVDWYDKAPKFGGFVQMFTGEQNLDIFGQQLTEFANGYKTFSSIMSGATILAKAKLDAITEFMKWAENDVPKSGSIFEVFTGTSSFDKLGTNLQSFGTGYSMFADAVKNAASISDDQMKRLSLVLETVATDSSNLSFRIETMVSVSKSLSDVGSNLVDFGNVIRPIDFVLLNEGVTFLEKLLGIGATLSDKNVDNGFKQISSTMNELTTSLNSEVVNMSNNTVTTFADSIKNAFLSDTVTERYSIILATARGWFTNIIDNIVDDVDARMYKITNAANELVKKFNLSFNNSADTKKAVGIMLDHIVDTIRDRYHSFVTVGEYLSQGFSNGMMSYYSQVVSSARELGRAAAEALRDELDIHSPSKITERIGSYFGEGFIKSLDRYSDKSYEAAANMADSAQSGLRITLSKISDFLDDTLEIHPVISPVLDTSDISSGMRSLTGFNANRTIKMAASTGVSFNDTRRNIQTLRTTANDGMVSSINDLRHDVNNMMNTMRNLQVVMDTGTLVGQITGPLDTALGTKISRNTRGGM